MTDQIRPPWTPEQVAALNAFQQRGRMHPFTCGGEHTPDSPALVAYADGWRCPQPYGEHCDYQQDWAHAFMADPATWPKSPFGERHGPTPGEMRRATLIDTEVRKQLHAVIKALGASETENKQLRAAIARVRALAGRIRQGVPWTANADDIAAHIVAAVDGDRAPAASCSPAAAETEPNNPRTTLDNPAASSWTPPPPGDRREQLPPAVLALLPARDYLSTACDTAQQLEHAPAPTPTSGGAILDVDWYVQMLHARCRRNQKFTGQLCGCGCHPHAVPDFTSPIAGRIEVREPCPWCAGTPMIARTLMNEHVARLHPEAATLNSATPNATRIEPDPPVAS